MDEIILKNENGQVVTSSRDVAEKFGKRHDSILRDIDNLIKSDSTILWSEMFVETSYTNGRGKEYRCFNINRDGFSLLCMGFTGKEALEWKLKYINAFNKMEEKLKSGASLTDEERYKLQLFSKDPSEVAYAHQRLVEIATAPLNAKIEEQKPLVEFANKVSGSYNVIDMGRMAKLLKDEHINIGRNRLFQWIRQKEILMTNNIPYQRYIDAGYFQVKESTYETPFGTKTQQTTYVTGK